MDIMTTIANAKVVPVVVIKDLSEAEPTLRALCEGGLPIAEITFRTACAADAIRLAVEKFPDMLVGAGTVINRAQAEKAIACGAKFIVGPGFSAEVAETCQKADVPYLPGCVTPTEIITAISYGIEIVKFFPCSNYGGLGTLKALSAAFPSVRFLPTGGISADNLLEYLAFDKIVACGGSWMMKGTPDEIREKTAAAVALAASAK
ncbi:MAG: bifunctional 4-hydroxy-2-oxoglutarate aldolase/2-dehydro-3-deoxy-phosphogluconate aldolase [Ruminococcaceae bacterium]|nr:bifunctional 4-hydroxy-2-oxoglutarate aldolase/2-dehydro-3-deoxy-phosphogluconate aldolase [Oscillospiraceae bacterium]